MKNHFVALSVAWLVLVFSDGTGATKLEFQLNGAGTWTGGNCIKIPAQLSAT